MAPIPSRVPSVQAELRARFTTAVAALSPPATVYRGPVLSGSRPKRAVYVGYDGDPGGENRAVDVTRVWKGLGAKARDETSVVYCAVVALIGGTDAAAITAAQDDAFTVFAVLEDALLADLSLGQPLPAQLAISDLSLHTEQATGGLQIRLAFQVTITTRITRI